VKTIFLQMEEVLADHAFSLVLLLTITRKDGVIVRITDCDHEVTFAGETWLPVAGIKRSALTISAGLQSNGMDVSGFFEEGVITEDDIDSGRLDGARVGLQLVEPTSPDTFGPIPLPSGRVADVDTDRDTFTLKINDDAELLQQTFGEVTSPGCRANLGDVRCGKDLTAFTHTATVASVIDARTFTVSISQAVGYFDYGVSTFTDGPNVGVSLEIKEQTAADRIELFLNPFYPVEVGHSVTLVAGCNKLRSTCKNKFGNVINMRAEPDLPGITAMTTAADRRLP
jgi:uncharacterized phage protein (TIGR02218 family)